MNASASLLRQKQEKLADALGSNLLETAFDNRYSLHPRRLAEFGREFTKSFLQFIEDERTIDTFGLGGKLAREGLGEKAILQLGTRIRRFIREDIERDREPHDEALDVADAFTTTLLAGYIKAREEQILTDQEQMRCALAAALESKSQELVIKNHAVNTSINGIMLADLDGKVTWVNSSFLQMWGLGSAQDVLGSHFGDFLVGEDVSRTLEALFRSGGWHGQISARRRNDSTFSAELFMSLIKNEEGGTIGIMTSVIDITEHLRAEEMEKNLLLVKEIHHRIKNNLQVISSLLFLQSSYVRDAKTREMFKESQNRVRSMALIHEKLYKSKSLEGVDFTEYIKDLAHNLITFHGAAASQVDLKVAAAGITLGMDTAVPCGLIINELVSNSLKHAFTPDKPGEIRIDITPSERPPAADTGLEGGKWFRLIVSDNGRGFPEDVDFRATESLGLQIVCNLTDQLDGTIELDRQRGTRFTIIFKEM